MTVPLSLAVPLNVGVVSLEGDFGALSVTVGDFVSTSNVRGSLEPGGLSSELGWLATAVYWASGRAGLASPEIHVPPIGVAVALDTGDPVAVPPR